jgi:hypothetical protein
MTKQCDTDIAGVTLVIHWPLFGSASALGLGTSHSLFWLDHFSPSQVVWGKQKCVNEKIYTSKPRHHGYTMLSKHFIHENYEFLIIN